VTTQCLADASMNTLGYLMLGLGGHRNTLLETHYCKVNIESQLQCLYPFASGAVYR